jgi:hypothetical protein
LPDSTIDVVGVEAAEGNADARQHRRLDVGAEAIGLDGRRSRVQDNERLAASGAGEAFDQMAIDRGPDAECEYVRGAEVGAHEVHRFLLDRHVAIGDDDEAARALRVRWNRECSPQRRQQLGRATAALRVDEASRGVDVLFRGRQRLRRQLGITASERDDVEGVGRAQVRDQAAQQRLRRFDRKAVHRSRNVEHEDVLAWDDGGVRHAGRRLDHCEEEVFLLAFVQQHSGGDLAPGQAILEDDVAVGMLDGGRETRPNAAFASGDVEAMRR